MPRLLVANIGFHGVFVALLLFSAALVATPAQAQRPLQQVLDLNRQAMDDYTNMEFPRAMERLEEALNTARRGRVTGAPLARTHMNLGVVNVGGMGDNAAGLDHFVAALRADGAVQLDPLTSTPEIQTVFNLARQRAGGGRPAGGDSGSSQQTPPREDPEPPIPSGPTGPAPIPHDPIPEQLRQTAVPVFVEVPDDAPVGKILLHFRATGMSEFRRVEMLRVDGGYGYEIPCTDVFEPAVEYYILALDDGGEPIGIAGSPDEPLSVPIVAQRTMDPPSLPGMVAPEQCSDAECPPGMECSQGGQGAGLGETCVSTDECRRGLTCADNFCIARADDDDDDDDDGDDGDGPRFFLHVGGAFGSAYVSAGMRADTPKPPGLESQEDSPWVDCQDDADGNGANDSNCSVRVQNPGFVPTTSVRIAAGYYITSRIAAAAYFRYQLSAGEGQLANMLFGVRGQYLITQPSDRGLHAALMLGTSYGQIQPLVDQQGEIGPHIISGLNGVQVGGVIGYRFVRNFGIVLTPEVSILLPTFLFNIDFIGALEVGF